MAKVSIVVPAYNAADYLPNCVESVLNQTESDWELLLVDDGSTDATGAVCDEFAAKDARIRPIHQSNAGVGAARNAGLAAACGEYIAFLDSDDAYEPDYLSVLLSLAESSGADVTAVGAKRVDPEGNVLGELALSAGVIIGTEEILRHFLLDPFRIYGCWNRLFRRNVISDVRFSALTQGEDALFCLQVLSGCSIYAVSSATPYLYTSRPGSATASAFKPRRMELLAAWEQIYSIVQPVAEDLGNFAAWRIIRNADIFYQQCEALPEEQRRPVQKTLRRLHKKYYPLQFSGKKMPARKKAAHIAFQVNPGLYFYLAKHTK